MRQMRDVEADRLLQMRAGVGRGGRGADGTDKVKILRYFWIFCGYSGVKARKIPYLLKSRPITAKNRGIAQISCLIGAA